MRNRSDQLSPREVQILTFYANSHSVKEIAATLGLATGTVAQHTSKIYLKLNVCRRNDAIRVGRALGYITPETAPEIDPLAWMSSRRTGA